LLVLDNLEQLAGAGPPIADLLEACPQLTILATSREPLRIRAEHLYRLDVLGLPDTTTASSNDALAGIASTAMFLQSMTALHYGYQPSPTDAPAIAELCIRLDGLPLAIELAAARCYEHTPAEVLAQIRQWTRIVVLRDGPQDLPERHRTLHDLVLWSYDLLTEAEQALFRRLAVFAGGIELDALDAIGGENAMPLANALADKSLVQWTHADGARRLVMLETIRDVAALLLSESGTDREVRVTHARFHADLAARSELAFAGVDQLAVIGRFGRDIDNLRAALTWATSGHAASPTTGLEIIAHSGWFWHSRGHTREGYDWLISTMEAAPPEFTHTRALAAYWLGTLALRHADIPAFEKWAQLCSELSAALGDPHIDLLAGKLVSQHMQRESRWDECVDLNTRMLAVARDIDHKPAIMDRLIAIGSAEHYLGQLDGAGAHLDEALQIAQDTSNLLYQSKILSFAVGIAYDQGNTVRMAELLNESERIALLADDRETLAWTVYHRTGLAEHTGDFKQGAAHAQRAISLFADIGAQRMVAGAMLTHAVMEARQGLITQALASFHAAIEAARSMGSTEEFLSCVLEVGYLGLPAGQPGHGLTLIAAADCGFRQTGETINDVERIRFDEHVAATRAALPFAIADRAWDEGRAMSLTDALSLAEDICHHHVTAIESVA
jgi:non-specific serine/threonine protein kinase